MLAARREPPATVANGSALAGRVPFAWRLSCIVLAWSSSAVGEMDQAMVFAQRAYDERDPFLSFASHWPDFARLRADERFQELLRRMRFPS